MKKVICILSIIVIVLLVFSAINFASEEITVKEYIKDKLPVIFNIYLSSLGDLDEYEKEFIDLLIDLPADEQKVFAKEINNNGFSEEILEKIKNKDSVDKPDVEIAESNVEVLATPDTGKWVYKKEIDPLSDKEVITFILECEKVELNKPIFLIIKKEGRDTIIYIDWNRELKTIYRNIVTVWTRFDENKASHSTWETYNATKEIILEAIFGKQPKVSSQYTFYPRRETKFIRKLMDTEKFIAQLKSINKMTLTAVFDVRGLRNAVEQFNDTFNWIKD